MKQQLIMITGPPSIGKTVAADALFKLLNNCAHLDGDWLWKVNPYDHRLRNGDKNMSFTLSTYLKSAFDYVIFSSCILVVEDIRRNIISDIDHSGFTTVVFWLVCSPETLKSRHCGQESTCEPAYDWLKLVPHSNDIVINTDDKNIEQVSKEIYEMIIENQSR
jgi:adenylylsulfate kinase-like enzyme